MVLSWLGAKLVKADFAMLILMSVNRFRFMFLNSEFATLVHNFGAVLGGSAS